MEFPKLHSTFSMHTSHLRPRFWHFCHAQGTVGLQAAVEHDSREQSVLQQPQHKTHRAAPHDPDSATPRNLHYLILGLLASWCSRETLAPKLAGSFCVPAHCAQCQTSDRAFVCMQHADAASVVPGPPLHQLVDVQTVEGEDPHGPISSEYAAMVICKALPDVERAMKMRHTENGVYSPALHEKHRVWLAERLNVPQYQLLTRDFCVTQDNASIHPHMRIAAANGAACQHMQDVRQPRGAHGVLQSWEPQVRKKWDKVLERERETGSIARELAQTSSVWHSADASHRWNLVLSKALAIAQREVARTPEATALSAAEREVLRQHPEAHTLYPHQVQPLGENMCDLNRVAEHGVCWCKQDATVDIMGVILAGEDAAEPDSCLKYARTYVHSLQKTAAKYSTADGRRTIRAAMLKSQATTQLVAADRGSAVEVQLVKLNKKTREITSTPITAKGEGGAWVQDPRIMG